MRDNELVVLMEHEARPKIRRQGAQPCIELRGGPVRLAHVVAFESGGQERAEHRGFARIVVLGRNNGKLHSRF
jgi:hypothetical protein